MAKLKIEILNMLTNEPKTTIKIPVSILSIASKLLPEKAKESLKAQGVDLNEIVELSKNPELEGTLIEIEEHEDNERIIISLI